MVGREGRDEAPLARLARDDGQSARQLAVQLCQLLFDLRGGRSVRVPDVVGSLQVDEHEIGHVIRADGLVLEDGGEGVSLEALEDRGVAELRRVGDVVSHPRARLFPGTCAR